MHFASTRLSRGAVLSRLVASSSSPGSRFSDRNALPLEYAFDVGLAKMRDPELTPKYPEQDILMCKRSWQLSSIVK